ncbi:MAG: ATP-binding protein [Hyphomicrobiaceae bacterium]|nr:ATP-binding protein [Hyphomicrobiaceae bacterium]
MRLDRLRLDGLRTFALVRLGLKLPALRVDSLAFRLFATSVAWTLLVLPLAGLIIYSLYRDDVQASFDVQLKKLVTAIAVDSLLSDTSTPVEPQNRYEPLFEVTHSGWYWQIRPLGNATGPVLRSASLATAALASPFELGYPEDPDTSMRWRNDVGPDGSPVRIVEFVHTPSGDGAATRYSVIVAGPLEWFDTAVATFRNRLTIALALAGLGLVALTLLQVRFVLEPVRQVERALADIRSGRAETLAGEVPAEIEPLREELNALIRSNQEIIERARTQVGNLAHALKTPLAVILNEARADRGGTGTKVAEQAEIMRNQVNHYLDRARMVASTGVIGRATAVKPVVDALARALQRLNADKGLVIEVDCDERLRFQGEKHDLEEMLGNLVDNASKWAKSRVRLTVSPVSAPHRRLAIAVEDDGPGLSEDEMQRIGKRGLRLDESKPGSGLGLSIVIELAQGYRGSFRLARSELGGLAAHLELPAV